MLLTTHKQRITYKSIVPRFTAALLRFRKNLGAAAGSEPGSSVPKANEMSTTLPPGQKHIKFEFV
jgi:hypothetical protein